MPSVAFNAERSLFIVGDKCILAFYYKNAKSFIKRITEIFFYLEDGNSIFLRNFHVPDYTVLQPKPQYRSEISPQIKVLYLTK
jgi:hypothetical protein